MQELVQQQQRTKRRETPPAHTMLDALLCAVKEQKKGHTELGKQVSRAVKRREERKYRSDDWR